STRLKPHHPASGGKRILFHEVPANMTLSSSSPPTVQSSSAARTAQSVVRHGRVLTHPSTGIARVEADSFAFGAMPVTLPAGESVPHEATPGELLAVAQA